jgi:hypothetical protein
MADDPVFRHGLLPSGRFARFHDIDGDSTGRQHPLHLREKVKDEGGRGGEGVRPLIVFGPVPVVGGGRLLAKPGTHGRNPMGVVKADQALPLRVMQRERIAQAVRSLVVGSTRLISNFTQ